MSSPPLIDSLPLMLAGAPPPRGEGGRVKRAQRPRAWGPLRGYRGTRCWCRENIFYFIPFRPRLCPSTAESRPPPPPQPPLHPLVLSLSLSLPVAPQCHITEGLLPTISCHTGAVAPQCHIIEGLLPHNVIYRGCCRTMS